MKLSHKIVLVIVLNLHNYCILSSDKNFGSLRSYPVYCKNLSELDTHKKTESLQSSCNSVSDHEKKPLEDWNQFVDNLDDIDTELKVESRVEGRLKDLTILFMQDSFLDKKSSPLGIKDLILSPINKEVGTNKKRSYDDSCIPNKKSKVEKLKRYYQ